MLVAPLDTLEMVTDVARPIMSKELKAELFVELPEAHDCDGSELPEPRVSAAMLYAAANWFCRLELPRCTENLWAGPPLAGRQRALA